MDLRLNDKRALVIDGGAGLGRAVGMSNTLRSALVGWSQTLDNEVAAKGATVNMVLLGL
jgi:hypothetical protein